MPHIVHEKELQIPSPVQEISSVFLQDKKIKVFIKRDDLIHPEISGNKWRKLKYALQHVKKNNLNGIVTFGGAYSNHVLATAAACNLFGLKSVAYIRGEELQPENKTLKAAAEFGMEFHFLSREDYRKKTDKSFLNQIKNHYPNSLIIPEGGYTSFALKGVSEILDELNFTPDYISTACGTGATAAGLCYAEKAQIIGIPVLKNGQFIQDEVEQLLGFIPENLQLFTEYHFGGYARIKADLIRFMDDFQDKFKIELDCVYTAKHFYAIFDLIEKNYFKPNSQLVLLHTGGLQGNEGMKDKMEKLRKTELYRQTQFQL